MLETLNDLRTRRSVRAFKPEQITEAELNAVLEAGTFAPTGRGLQSPIIIVLQKREDIAALSRLNAQILGSSADPFYGAPTVLVVLAKRDRTTHVLDGAAVLTNLLNAAHAVGLGSCWIHRAKEEFESEEGKQMLEKWGVADEYEGVGHCILGYAAAENKPAAPRKADYIIRV